MSLLTFNSHSDYCIGVLSELTAVARAPRRTSERGASVRPVLPPVLFGQVRGGQMTCWRPGSCPVVRRACQGRTLVWAPERLSSGADNAPQRRCEAAKP